MDHGEKEEMTVEIENVHKTYLLGVEGVPALRYATMAKRVLADAFLKMVGRNAY